MTPSIHPTRSIAIVAFVVALTVAACGGNSSSIAPSGDQVTPEPSPAVTPAASMPEMSGAPALHVTLETQDDSDVRVAVIDETGLLTGATSGTPGDGASVPIDAPTVVDAEAASLLVTWAAPPCDSEPMVVLSESRLLIVQPECPAPTDAVAFDRVLILRFADTMDAASLEVRIQDGLDTGG
jgi:hypothetical protein